MWVSVNHTNLLAGRPRARLRTIGPLVLHGQLNIPRSSVETDHAWCEALADDPITEVALIKPFERSEPLIEPVVKAAMRAWLADHRVRHEGKFTAFACSGAQFHNDYEAFPNEAFCVAWLSEDLGWDLLFPTTGQRVPLCYGTVALFDSGLPHGVVQRGHSKFDFDQFPFETGTFVSLDLRLNRKLRRLLGIGHCSRHGKRGVEIMYYSAANQSDIDGDTGAWNLRVIDKRGSLAL